MITQIVQPTDIVSRLNNIPQEVNNLANVRHSTSIDGISAHCNL
jgi:hypothetical protein